MLTGKQDPYSEVLNTPSYHAEEEVFIMQKTPEISLSHWLWNSGSNCVGHKQHVQQNHIKDMKCTSYVRQCAWQNEMVEKLWLLEHKSQLFFTYTVSLDKVPSKVLSFSLHHDLTMPVRRLIIRISVTTLKAPSLVSDRQ